MYVWTESQRKGLLQSVNKNLPCGNITIAEIGGHQYLIDGLQRLTSLIILSNDSTLDKDQKTAILNYNITAVTVHSLDNSELSQYFRALNSGTAVASIVKARSSLPQNVQDNVLSISSMPFFKKLSEKANATFSKNHHHEIIAMATLQAATGIGASGIRAKDLCANLTDLASKTDISMPTARHIIGRIASAFSKLDEKIVKRAANANYMAVLAFVLADNTDITANAITNVTSTIFEKGKAVPEYSLSTGSNCASKEKVSQRGKLLASMLTAT